MNWIEFENFTSRLTQWIWQPETKSPEVPIDASWGAPTKDEEQWADAWLEHFFNDSHLMPLSPRDRYVLLPRFRYVLMELSFHKTLLGHEKIGELASHVQKLFINQWYSDHRAKWLAEVPRPVEQKADTKKFLRKRKNEMRGKKCGLCGKKANLMQTPCCGEWICDDEHEYVAFSFAHNSCSRNHRKQTLCYFHYSESHAGNWWECDLCRKAFRTPDYVFYGTNDFNFRILLNPPAFEPIRCARCSRVIEMGKDGFIESNGKYHCQECAAVSLPFLS